MNMFYLNYIIDGNVKKEAQVNNLHYIGNICTQDLFRLSRNCMQDIFSWISVRKMTFFSDAEFIQTYFFAVCVTSCTALLALFLRGAVDASFAGLALAYAAQLSGIFQYTVRLSTETEARFTSVQRLSDCSKVHMKCIESLYILLYLCVFFYLSLLCSVFPYC